MQIIFLIENDIILILPNAEAAIAIIKLAPITSSTENTFLLHIHL